MLWIKNPHWIFVAVVNILLLKLGEGGGNWESPTGGVEELRKVRWWDAAEGCWEWSWAGKHCPKAARELEVYPGFVISQLSWVVNDRHDGAGRESPDGQRSEGELECTQCSDYSVLRKWESKWRWNFAFALFVEWSISFN